MPTPIARTAFYCTGVRMLDAQSPAPLVGDTWAERFMEGEGQAFFEPFRAFPIPNGSNVVRHHIIDELLRARLATDPRRRVLLLGAGFDMRAFRLRGGEWFEVDEAPLIERKNQVAPAAQAPNPLTRLVIDFATDSLADRLAPLATDAPVTVVLEGVLYYLEAAAVEQTLRTLQRLFPRHELICDLQSDLFVRKWGGSVIRAISKQGAAWRFHPPNPAAFIEALGYHLGDSTSIALRAAELRRISPPAFAIRWLLPSLRDGFRVYVFSYHRS